MFRKSTTPKTAQAETAQAETTQSEIAAPRALSAKDILLASGGDGTPAPPPKTCVSSCERVKDTNITVCAPTICF